MRVIKADGVQISQFVIHIELNTVGLIAYGDQSFTCPCNGMFPCRNIMKKNSCMQFEENYARFTLIRFLRISAYLFVFPVFDAHLSFFLPWFTKLEQNAIIEETNRHCKR